MGVSNDGLWQGTLRDFDHAIPPGCTSPWDGGRAGFSTILTCRVRYYCWRSGLLNMGLLTDLILILILIQQYFYFDQKQTRNLVIVPA